MSTIIPMTRTLPMLCVVSIMLSACGESARVTSSTFPPGDTGVGIATAPPKFKTPSKPSTIFLGADSLYKLHAEVHWGLPLTRLVLGDDGTFTLEFSSTRAGLFAYAGSYSRAGSLITFAFDSDVKWRATGETHGDAILLRFNSAMSLSDFEDGTYLKVPE